MSGGLSAQDILFVWERGRALHPVDRALLLLAAAAPELPHNALAGMPVGERDSRLMRVRAQTLGERFDAVTNCPSCAGALEFSFPARDFIGAAPNAPDPIATVWEEIELRLRSPDSRDLATAANLDVANGRRLLLGRCLVSASRAGENFSAADLPQGAAEAAANLLAQRNPCSDIRFAVRCDACGHAWSVPFDIAAYLWSEISALARGILRDVVQLARLYGWSESEILSLSPARRQLYLEMAV